jgi:uncharacterized membrane protein
VRKRDAVHQRASGLDPAVASFVACGLRVLAGEGQSGGTHSEYVHAGTEDPSHHRRIAAIGAGAIALCATKGSTLHRRSGTVFVVAMLCMSASGAFMAALKPDRGTALGGVLTFYLVSTAWLTVRCSVEQSRALLGVLMFMALALGASHSAFAFAALYSTDGRFDGLPPQPFFLFGAVGLLAALGDARVLHAGKIEGARRVARHLWRMGFAMFIATASFFVGQPKVFPEPLRHAFGLRAIPVLLVIAVTLYWFVRVLRQRTRSRGRGAADHPIGLSSRDADLDIS